MGLLEKLKSALGLDGARSSETHASGDVDVTVEREPSTEDEDAVKGTDTATPTTAEADAGVEPADGSTDDEGEATDVAEDESEADAAEDADEDDAAADADEDDAAEDATEEADIEGSDDPVTELNGIGPAYAERLAGLDIETVGELAVADAADIADQTDLGEKRVADWIDQAQSY
jgi:predicted flap endonuclease-1-like 5' DNA nuclease